MNESQGQFVIGLLVALVAQGMLREATRCWKERPDDPWYWWGGVVNTLVGLGLLIASSAILLGEMWGGGR